MSEKKKEDRRVMRTKRAIKTAFAQLLSKKDYSDISVTDIAEAADINRKTFYNYYHSADHLLDEIQREIICHFDEVISGAGEQDEPLSPEAVLTKVSSLLHESLGYVSEMVVLSNNGMLFNRIADNLRIQFRELLLQRESVSPATADVVSVFMLSGLMGLYSRWVRDGRPMDKEELDGIAIKLCAECIKYAFG